MYRVGETTAGNILVEMTPREWEAVTMLFKANDIFIDHLGEELARYRRESGLSQSAVAHKLGVSRAYVSLIERGLADNVSNEVRRRIAQLVRGN